MKAGERYRVKSTQITRRYGVRVRGGARGDDCAWPGEVGTVVERRWTAATTGEAMSGLWLEFPRGRSHAVRCLDPADFVRVKAPKAEALP